MDVPDDNVIDRVLAGERRAYSILVERYQQMLMQYLWNLLPNHHDCEEVVQDTFLQAFRKLETFDEAKASFSTWLMVIARNRAINLVNKRRPTTMSALPEQPADSDPLAPMRQGQWRERLDQALQQLSFEQRAAFVLIEIQDLSYSAAATIENVSPGTIKSRVARAKEKLRAALPHTI